MNEISKQPAGEQPKKLTDITDDDIKEAAIVYAVKFGWQIEPRDCRVEPIPNIQRINEIGLGSTEIQLLTSSWQVYITPRVPPNIFTLPLRVKVEFLIGGLCADEFVGRHHPPLQ